MNNMEQAALEAATNKAPVEAETHDTIPDAPGQDPTLKEPTNPEDTLRDAATEKSAGYEEAAQGVETAAKVMEQPIIQRGMNALADQLDGSWAMKPIEKVWNLMPKSMQEVCIHPVTGLATGATPAGLPVLWFQKLEKAGLLEVKGRDEAEAEQSQEERQKTEEAIRSAAGEVAKIATGGEASGLVDLILKVVNAQDNLLEGMRTHLAETRTQKKTEEIRQDIDKAA